jgi:hypothetical protein
VKRIRSLAVNRLTGFAEMFMGPAMPRLRLAGFAVLLTLASPTAALAQTVGSAPGIGLTPDHKRVIYSEVSGDKVQHVPDASALSIGREIPDSIILSEMPVSVKDRIAVLRDYKFAKLPDEKIVIVDPLKRRVVDVVTKEEGTR